MKAVRTEFREGVPAKKLYEPGEDFREHEYELNSEEALALFETLGDPRDHLYLYASEDCHLDFHRDERRDLWVEIQDSGFWAISEIPSLEAARAIIEIAQQGRAFDDHVPTTTEEWDAYGTI